MSSSAEDLNNWSQPVNLLLRNGPASVRTARRFTNDLLSRWGLSNLRDDALLCLSELVSNAVVYSGSPAVSLRVSRHGSELRLEVRDSRPLDQRFADVVKARQEEHRHHPMLQPVEGGRGLLLVDELSQTWGVTSLDDDGKVVWCVLAADLSREARSRPDTALAGSHTALLLQTPTRYLVAHERRVESVLQALRRSDKPPGSRDALIQRIEKSHLAHQQAQLQNPVEPDGAVLRERIDLAFDSDDQPYRSAAELIEALAAAEVALGLSASVKGLSDEDLLAFEQWYVDELRRQSDGETPAPCPFPARAGLGAV